MEFINRKWEINFLNDAWAEEKAHLIIIYGKRQVGKTELVLHFARDKPHIYFLCERMMEHQLIYNFFWKEFL